MNKEVEQIFEHCEKLFLEAYINTDYFREKKDYDKAYAEQGKQRALIKIRDFILNLSKDHGNNI